MIRLDRIRIGVVVSVASAVLTAHATPAAAARQAPTISVSPEGQYTGDNGELILKSHLLDVDVCGTQGTIGVPALALNGVAVPASTSTVTTVAGCTSARHLVFPVPFDNSANNHVIVTVSDGIASATFDHWYTYDERFEHRMVVVPLHTTVTVPNGSATDTFLVTNPGWHSTQYRLAPSCTLVATGAVCASVTSPATVVTVGAGVTLPVPVTYSTPAGPGVSEQVQLTVYNIPTGWPWENPTFVATTTTDQQPPTITVSPTQTYTADDGQPVLRSHIIDVDVCDADGAVGVPTLAFNGGTVTPTTSAPATVTGCATARHLEYAMPFVNGTNNHVVATVSDGYHTASADKWFNYDERPEHYPAVIARRTTVQMLPSAAMTDTFLVTNTGWHNATYTLTPSCTIVSTSAPCSSVGVPAGQVTIAPADTVRIPVAYTAPSTAATSANVVLRANYVLTGWPWAAATVVATTVPALADFRPDVGNPSTSSLPPGEEANRYFTVVNLSMRAATYQLSTICPAAASCSVDHANLTLAAGASGDARVTFTSASPAPATESVQLVATYTDAFGRAIADTGTLTVSSLFLAQLSQPQVVPHDAAIAVAPNLTLNQHFWVHNTGTEPGRYWFDCSTTGGPFTWVADQISVLSVGPFPCGDATHVFVVAPQDSMEVMLHPRTSASVGVTGTVILVVTNQPADGSSSGASGHTSITTIASGTASAQIAVSPASSGRPEPAGSDRTATFTVTNSANASDQIAYSAACSGAVTCAPFSGQTDVLPHDGSQRVDVPFHVVAGTGGTGAITLSVHSLNNSAAATTGTWTITRTTPPVMAVARALPDAIVARDQCLTLAAGDAAAYECGDLRLAHAMPATITMGQARAPVLTYTSRQANGQLLVPADVTVPAGSGVTSITAHVKIGPDLDHLVERGTVDLTNWQAFNDGVARRIIVPTNVANLLTGVYAYRVAIDMHTLSNPGGASDDGTIAVVNRVSTPFGPGWWLDGLEELRPVTGHSDQFLWIGSDGSTRVYTRLANSTTIYMAPTLDRVDSLEHSANGGGYHRHLPNGAYVLFDETFKQVGTVDQLADTTKFGWNSDARLETITLPVPHGSTASRVYTFSYAGGLLTSITAPPGPKGARVTTLVRTGSDLAIQDPGVAAVHYLADGQGQITLRTNRLGDHTQYTFDPAANTLTDVSIDMSRTQPGHPLHSSFCAAEATSVASCAPQPRDLSHVVTTVDGPREDVNDVTTFALTPFGAPRIMTDALGHITTIERTDLRFPLVPTAVVAANGLRTETTLNDRGLPLTVMSFDIFKDPNNPTTPTNDTTTYQWDSKWDAPITVTSTHGVVAQTQYDRTYGTVDWQQTGTDASRRVTYHVNSVTHLLETVTPPAPLGVTTYVYDELGNDSVVVNPRSLKAITARDALGRPSLITTPIDALGTKLRVQTIEHDLADRAIVAVDSAPTSADASIDQGWQSVHVITAYDDESRATSVTRRMGPTLSTANDIVESVEYDQAGRILRRYDPNRGNLTLATWAYTPDGKSVTVTTPRGGGTPSGTDRVDLDVLGRPEHREISGLANDPTTADAQDFHYDAMGNLTSATNKYASVGREYFPNGTLKQDTQCIAKADLTGDPCTAHQYVLQFTYDRGGRRLTMIRPAVFAGTSIFGTTSYDYDYAGGGALWHLSDPQIGTFTYATNVAGLLESVTRPDGTIERHDFRNDGMPLSRSDGTATAPAAMHGDTYTFDGRGKTLTMASSVFGSATSSAFSYAGLGAALSATGPQSETYTRDPLGDVLTRSVSGGIRNGPYSYAYDANSTRLLRMVGTPALRVRDSVSRTYDLAGNVITSDQTVRMCPTNLACDPADEIGAWASLVNNYAGDGRLRVAELTTSNDDLAQGGATDAVVPYARVGRGVKEEYRYDALGRRVWRRAHHDAYCRNVPALPAICASFIERTVYDGDQVLAEIREATSDSTAIAEVDAAADGMVGIVAYLNGLDVDQPLAVARARTSGVVRLVLHRDWQGVADAGGLATDSFAGKIIDCGRPGALTVNEGCETIPWPGLDMSVGFQRPPTNVGVSEWWGTLIGGNRNETGTLDMRARQYDPTTGTFLQEDPLGIAGGLNTYGFGGGDAVNMRDPSGMWALHWGIKWTHPWRDIGHYGGAVAAFVSITAAELLTGGTITSAILAAGETVGATATGAAFAAAGESIISHDSFADLFMRDLNWSGWFLAASVAISPAMGGYAGAGAKTPLSGYVATKGGLGPIGGGLTLGSSTMFAAVNPGDPIFMKLAPTFLQHEFGHTLQYIGMSLSGRNPWIPYLGLGLIGAAIPGFGWEQMATWLGQHARP